MPHAPATRARPATAEVRPEHVAAATAALARALPAALATALAAAPAAAPAPRSASTTARLLARYARYLGLFVGAGLMAGAVVHFPLAPVRYGLMGVAGAALFTAGSAGGAPADRTRAGRALQMAASLALALGVGMVAGGIQHFGDVPRQAAVLIPSGLVIGLAAFAVREGHRPERRQAVPLAAAAIAVALVLGLALSALAPAPAAGSGAAHGAAAPASHSH